MTDDDYCVLAQCSVHTAAIVKLSDARVKARSQHRLGQLSLASIRGRLIEYQRWLG